MGAKQIRSKDRVSEHGEVFTSEREVNAMLDLVKQETERIDSRFLEPACGNGNFLTEILRRKLAIVKKQYGRNHLEYEKYAILALSSIYGVELLEDNTTECIERLYKQWNKAYTAVCKKDATDQCREAARYILRHNILTGNALDMTKADGSPIVFAQWDLAMGNKMQRRDYELDKLMKPQTQEMPKEGLFEGWEYDDETQAWIPAAIKVYPLMNYWEVQDADQY